MSESGAIPWYLAEKIAGLMPGDAIERIRALEYTFFQVGGVGPMFGQAGWFARHSERVPQHAGVRLDDYPAVRAWIERIALRHTVLRGLQAIA